MSSITLGMPSLQVVCSWPGLTFCHSFNADLGRCGACGAQAKHAKTSVTVNIVHKDPEASQSIQELQRAKHFKMKSRSPVKRRSTHKKVIAPSLSGCQAKANDEAPAITDPRASATRSARGKHDSGKVKTTFDTFRSQRPCPCLILSGCQAGDVAPGITADPSASAT